MTARSAATREQVLLASLAKRTLPGDRRLTWLDLAEQVAEEDGVHPVLILGRVRSKNIVRARHHFWAALRGAGYSYPEIASALGVDHSSVLAALVKLKARGKPIEGEPFGFAGMGAGAGI